MSKKKSKSYVPAKKANRKWSQPKKHRPRDTRQASKSTQQNNWLNEILEAEMILIGGAV